MRKRLSAILLVAVLAGVRPGRGGGLSLASITMVVPFSAGGPVDTLARILSERMRQSLGQPIIIDNVTGAAGTIGVGRVARAAADGYMLSIGHWSTHVVNGAIYALHYDLLRDFDPVVAAAQQSDDRGSQERGAGEGARWAIAWIKANESKVSAGTAGSGSGTHVAGVYFQNVTGTRFQFVPYRGSGPALQDLWPARSISWSTSVEFDAAGARGQDQGLCRDRQNEASLGAGNSDRGRGRRARARRQHLVWSVGAQGHAQGDHHQAQSCCGGRRWPIRPCASAWAISDWRFPRARSRRRKRSALIRGRRSRSGGRSSRPPASRENSGYSAGQMSSCRCAQMLSQTA